MGSAAEILGALVPPCDDVPQWLRDRLAAGAPPGSPVDVTWFGAVDRHTTSTFRPRKGLLLVATHTALHLWEESVSTRIIYLAKVESPLLVGSSSNNTTGEAARHLPPDSLLLRVRGEHDLFVHFVTSPTDKDATKEAKALSAKLLDPATGRPLQGSSPQRLVDRMKTLHDELIETPLRLQRAPTAQLKSAAHLAKKSHPSPPSSSSPATTGQLHQHQHQQRTTAENPTRSPPGSSPPLPPSVEGRSPPQSPADGQGERATPASHHSQTLPFDAQLTPSPSAAYGATGRVVTPPPSSSRRTSGDGALREPTPQQGSARGGSATPEGGTCKRGPTPAQNPVQQPPPPRTTAEGLLEDQFMKNLHGFSAPAERAGGYLHEENDEDEGTDAGAASPIMPVRAGLPSSHPAAAAAANRSPGSARSSAVAQAERPRSGGRTPEAQRQPTSRTLSPATAAVQQHRPASTATGAMDPTAGRRGSIEEPLDDRRSTVSPLPSSAVVATGGTGGAAWDSPFGPYVPEGGASVAAATPPCGPATTATTTDESHVPSKVGNPPIAADDRHHDAPRTSPGGTSGTGEISPRRVRRTASVTFLGDRGNRAADVASPTPFAAVPVVSGSEAQRPRRSTLPSANVLRDMMSGVRPDISGGRGEEAVRAAPFSAAVPAATVADLKTAKAALATGEVERQRLEDEVLRLHDENQMLHETQELQRARIDELTEAATGGRATADDVSQLVRQVLALQKQLLEERSQRQAHVDRAVSETQRTYDRVILRQQDELLALQGRHAELQALLARMRDDVRVVAAPAQPDPRLVPSGAGSSGVTPSAGALAGLSSSVGGAGQRRAGGFDASRLDPSSLRYSLHLDV